MRVYVCVCVCIYRVKVYFSLFKRIFEIQLDFIR